jgi:hypothetical protein
MTSLILIPRYLSLELNSCINKPEKAIAIDTIATCAVNTPIIRSEVLITADIDKNRGYPFLNNTLSQNQFKNAGKTIITITRTSCLQGLYPFPVAESISSP